MRSNNFRYLVKQGVASVWHNRMMSFASFCIMTVSLLLIGLAILVFFNINKIIGNIEEKNEVVLFLDEGISEADISHINDIITSMDNVDTAVYYSKEKALEDLLSKMPEFSVLFESLPENPVPESFKIKINDLSLISETIFNLTHITGVDSIEAPYDFANFLVGLRTTLGVIGSALFFALVVVCLVIISNATRTSVFTRRREINIMKYVGATNSFIRIPFFVEGMFIGILAGGVSWIMTKFAYESFFQLFTGDINLFSVLGTADIIPFSQITLWVLLANCTIGALLGAMGTLFSMGKHLKV